MQHPLAGGYSEAAVSAVSPPYLRHIKLIIVYEILFDL